MNAYDIIKRPIMSEKSYDGIARKKYTFEVDRNATKPQIRAAIETIYSGIKVEKVNTSIIRGKLKRQGKNSGMTPTIKKAVVVLTKDSKTIAAFDSLS